MAWERCDQSTTCDACRIASRARPGTILSQQSWCGRDFGTPAFEFNGGAPEPARSFTGGGQSMPNANPRQGRQDVEVRIRKPGGSHSQD